MLLIMLNKLYVLFIMFLKVCFSVLLGVGFRLLLWVFLMIFIILCYEDVIKINCEWDFNL